MTRLPAARRFALALVALLALLALPLGAFAADEAKGAIKPADDKQEPQISVKGAASEAAAKEKLRADALLARCVIKPVMTDEEIDTCKTAYRLSDAAAGHQKK